MTETGILSFAFDRRGAYVAAAYFLAPVLVLAGLLWLSLRARLRRDPADLPMSRNAQFLGFSVCVALYLAVLYYWLFWHTFYDMKVHAGEPGGGSLELTLLVPERTMSLALSDVSSLTTEPGPRNVGLRLQIVTEDGATYWSPVRARHEMSTLHRRLTSRLPIDGNEE